MKARILHRGLGPRKLVNITMGLFAALGFGMLLGSGLFLKSTVVFLAATEPAEGRVVDLEYSDGTYVPVVRFRSLSGEEITFRGGVGTSPPAFSQGETVVVRYDPRNPDNAKIDDFIQLWFGVLMLGGMGCLFGGIGGGYWGWGYVRGRQDAWLGRHGARISARIVDVGTDSTFSFNRQTPWRIRAQWQDPQSETVYVFNSRALWFDPTPFLQDKQIAVLIDRRDPGRYTFDLSFLPQENT